ncbi:MAG: hypothetical protein OIN87_09815 [Candidatus Methanoperedens sp.]|nr:hypothetical protein [Candidatus Methanoperedens sp.]
MPATVYSGEEAIANVKENKPSYPFFEIILMAWVTISPMNVLKPPTAELRGISRRSGKVSK